MILYQEIWQKILTLKTNNEIKYFPSFSRNDRENHLRRLLITS